MKWILSKVASQLSLKIPWGGASHSSFISHSVLVLLVEALSCLRLANRFLACYTNLEGGAKVSLKIDSFLLFYIFQETTTNPSMSSLCNMSNIFSTQSLKGLSLRSTLLNFGCTLPPYITSWGALLQYMLHCFRVLFVQRALWIVYYTPFKVSSSCWKDI